MIEAISHRGSHVSHPENTIGAVLAAVGEGADGVEIDVHAASDGVIVVHHDFFPRGTVADRRLASRPIADLSFAELQTFDLGAGERIPSLRDLLEALAGRARLYVEIKGRRCEELLAATLPADSNVAVHSFDHRSISRMAALAPSISRGVLQGSYMVDNCLGLKSAAATDLWQHFELIDAGLVEEVHACGGRVIAWTADSERDWERLAEAGVDAICTDDMSGLLRWRAGERG
ncbi:MAG: glycerophosphodiester phosphodiesterase [Gemmatimonadaceae bacterium]|nr:glycerophosphodiester phosphodiesterase [Gemmatimonadaceae bacterium]